jgi:hypothetical protein
MVGVDVTVVGASVLVGEEVILEGERVGEEVRGDKVGAFVGAFVVLVGDVVGAQVPPYLVGPVEGL